MGAALLGVVIAGVRTRAVTLLGLSLLIGSSCTGTSSRIATQTQVPIDREIMRYVGEWNESITWFRIGMDKPLLWKGHATSELLGRSWLATQHTADFLGMGYESSEILGCDREKKQWTAVWVDQITDGLLILTGEITEDGVLTLRGEIPSRDNGARVPFIRTDHWVDEDTLQTHWVRPGAAGAAAEEFMITARRVGPALEAPAAAAR